MRKIKNTKPPPTLPAPKKYVIDSRGAVHFISNNQSRITLMRDLKEDH